MVRYALIIGNMGNISNELAINKVALHFIYFQFSFKITFFHIFSYFELDNQVVLIFACHSRDLRISLFYEFETLNR